MIYSTPMTTATSSSEPYRICAICLHEHESPATMVHGFGDELICKDEDACEQREEANEKWPQSDHDIDWSDPPRSLSTDHLEEQASARYEDRYGSWDDHDGPDDDGGWD